MYTFEHAGYTYKHVAQKRHVITDADGIDHIVRYIPQDRPMQDIDVKRVIEHDFPAGIWSHERLAQFEEAELTELIVQHEEEWPEWSDEELEHLANIDEWQRNHEESISYYE